MLRKIRITFAVICFTLITLLFLDFTGTIHHWFGWLADVQLLPAILAGNFIIVTVLVLLTLLFGRIYCSVICPLGVMQDSVSWLHGTFKHNRFRYSRAISWLRYTVLAVFIVAIIVGAGSFVALLAPYSAYGRIASNLFAPLYDWCNNLLAYIAERKESYAFYTVDVWIKSISTFVVAAVTFLVLTILAWRNGRTYCNTICPVGTVLGLLSKFSLYRPTIDTTKCNSCGLCARNCKSSCINPKEHKIDYSRCVACMDCISECRQGAIKYTARRSEPAPQTPDDKGLSRRGFLSIAAILTATSVAAKTKRVDGGLAVIVDKQKPDRTTPILPAGSLSARHFAEHCTGCQLCVSSCPNQVLRPSEKLTTMMQPEMSYERGYCRPECTKCAEVCPTDAIQKISVADKSSIQIGHAVWIRKNCVVLTDNVHCNSCARHCPTGAITMIPSVADKANSPKIPAIDTERCIGCGACENLCPARPFSAIYVEGHKQHRTI